MGSKLMGSEEVGANEVAADSTEDVAGAGAHADLL